MTTLDRFEVSRLLNLEAILTPCLSRPSLTACETFTA